MLGAPPRALALALVLTFALVGCAGPAAPAGTSAAGVAQAPAKKRITAAVLKGDLASPAEMVDREARHLADLFQAGFSRNDPEGNLHPVLAEAVPTVENGLWRVFPDGRMETTWRLRTGIVWHDGAPITAEDFVFATRVQQDPELATRTGAAAAAMERIEAVDPRTVAIRWKTLYIFADGALGSSNPPLPKHLLEGPYIENKATFFQHPHWTEQFVAAGPFKLLQWERSSHLVMGAFDQYVLGRPKIDEIELRFIPDTGTLAANILAGAVEMTIGLALAPDQAAQLRDQWRDGTVLYSPYFATSVGVFPKLRDPNPRVVGEVTFRRALQHAADRQEVVDGILLGQSPVAHQVLAFLPRFGDLQASIVRYDYDPRRAAQLIEGLGYRKGTDGIYEESAGQKLAFDLWAIQEEQERVKGMFIVADYWRRAGIAVEPYLVPAQQQRDREFMASFPAFIVRGITGNENGLRSYFHSVNVPGPENRWQGNNYAHLASRELDGFIDQIFLTIPIAERSRGIAATLRYVTEQALNMGLFYNIDNAVLSNRLQNVTPPSGGVKTWNPHLWELKS